MKTKDRFLQSTEKKLKAVYPPQVDNSNSFDFEEYTSVSRTYYH